MALIKCPECGNSISDKANKCPHCGLPSAYFDVKKEEAVAAVDYSNIRNMCIAVHSVAAEEFAFGEDVLQGNAFSGSCSGAVPRRRRG